MYQIYKILDSVVMLILTVFWLVGIFLANGKVATGLSMIFPPYAWYLVVERVITKYNLF